MGAMGARGAFLEQADALGAIPGAMARAALIHLALQRPRI